MISKLTYSISSQDLADRLDVFHYLPKFKKINEIFSNLTCDVQPLSEIATIFGGSTPKDGSSTEKGLDKIKFLKTLNIRDFYLDLETVYYISKLSHEKRKTSALQKNDVLLNIIGATLKVVGRVAIIPEDFGETNLNQNIVGIRVNDSKKIDPYYLMAYLGSELAQIQIAKLSRQASQVNLNSKEVGEILVPIVSESIQKEIVLMIKNAQKELEKSKKTLEDELEKFDNDLETTFDLKIISEKSSSFIITSSELFDRIDVEYYKPIFRELEKNLIPISKPIGELADVSQIISEPKKFPEKIFRYVEIENLDPLLGKITEYQEILGKDAPSRAKILLKKNSIIVPSLNGTFNKIANVTPEFDGCIGTTGFLTLIPKKNQLYLFGILRSKIGQLQLTRSVTGAIMPTLTQQELSKVLIPIKPDCIDEMESSVENFLDNLNSLQNRIENIMNEVKNDVTKKIMNVNV
ncbi:MAG: restriction endonuclease subunit S [Thaumarchaeota archaeon]|nr:restriction endonuclease subunit S [Nitrososphaerota archaeon]